MRSAGSLAVGVWRLPWVTTWLPEHCHVKGTSVQHYRTRKRLTPSTGSRWERRKPRHVKYKVCLGFCKPSSGFCQKTKTCPVLWPSLWFDKKKILNKMHVEWKNEVPHFSQFSASWKPMQKQVKKKQLIMKGYMKCYWMAVYVLLIGWFSGFSSWAMTMTVPRRVQNACSTWHSKPSSSRKPWTSWPRERKSAPYPHYR